MVGIADDAVKRAQPVLVGRYRVGDGHEHPGKAGGVDFRHLFVLAQLYPARNMAQSQGWSSIVCNSPSSWCSVIEAPAISSEVQ